MADKPATQPTWSTDDTYTGGPDAGTATKVDPGQAKRNEGWRNQDRPPAQHWNHFANLQGRWIKWLESVADRVDRDRGVQWTSLDPALCGFKFPPVSSAPVVGMGYRPFLSVDDGPQWMCAVGELGTNGNPIYAADQPNRWQAQPTAGAAIGRTEGGKHPKCLIWSRVARLWIYATAHGAGNDPRVYTSPDGATWTGRVTGALTARQGHYAVAESGNRIVVTSDAGVTPHFYSSANGTAWTQRANPSGRAMRCIAWSPTLNRFVAAGDRAVVTSPDGITWTSLSVPRFAVWTDITWDVASGRFILVSSTGDVMVSSNGTVWADKGSVINGVNGHNVAVTGVDADGHGVILAAGQARGAGATFTTTAVSLSLDGGDTWKTLSAVCGNGLHIDGSTANVYGGVRYLNDRFWLFGSTRRFAVPPATVHDGQAIAYARV